MTTVFNFFFFFIIVFSYLNDNILSEAANMTESKSRIYDFTKCSGAGCPYTASWLAHVNLFRKLTWYLDSTKMEAASFTIFDKAKFKFQVSDPDAYYVHHMSMYEHVNHKKYNFTVAQSKAVTMSKHAFKGECDGLKVSHSKEFMALVPFYGGLPPGVTKDLKVGSLGQGNSLMDPSTKALQAISTVCSCLKYFGHVTVGVASLRDRQLMGEMIDRLSSDAKHRINVVQFSMAKPAHLPFHLLNWGQHFVQRHNCQQLQQDTQVNDTKQEFDTVAPQSVPSQRLLAGRNHKQRSEAGYFGWPEETKSFDPSQLPEGEGADLYEICGPEGVAQAHGAQVNVTYMKKLHSKHTPTNGSKSVTVDKDQSARNSHAVLHPIKYVYFTECDQVVRFDDMDTLLALTAASNETCFFTGRRREKSADSPPEDYMSGLDNWRNCGVPGYSLHWPRDFHVKFE